MTPVIQAERLTKTYGANRGIADAPEALELE